MSIMDLANRVIELAVEDAESPVDNYDRREARNFLMAKTPYWRRSLEVWCDLSNKNINSIIRYARIKYDKGGKYGRTAYPL